MRSIEVLVAGGGASGMMAAITAAENGAKVLLLEKMNRLGKKLLATGNGKCNYTNLKQSPEYYHCRQEKFPWEVLKQFGSGETIAWFQERGIIPKDRDGYVYPLSGQAVSVVNVLQREIKRLGVTVQTEECVQWIEPHHSGRTGEQDGYRVVTDCGEYLVGQIILAVGGMASPVHGSDGDGCRIAEELGISCIRSLPALTSLVLKGKYVKLWSGVRVQGQITLCREDGTVLAGESGELQMVAYGISGIPVFQISYLAAEELARGRKVSLILDCIPDFSADELQAELRRRQREYGSCSAADLLEGILHQKLAAALLAEVGLRSSTSSEEIKEFQWETLVREIKQKKLEISGVSGFDKAQVTHGGADTTEVEPETMEVRKCPGLYLTGELLDVDGICGGYNLQWAWTSGYLAGRCAGKKAEKYRQDRIKRKEKRSRL